MLRVVLLEFCSTPRKSALNCVRFTDSVDVQKSYWNSVRERVAKCMIQAVLQSDDFGKSLVEIHLYLERRLKSAVFHFLFSNGS